MGVVEMELIGKKDRPVRALGKKKLFEDLLKKYGKLHCKDGSEVAEKETGLEAVRKRFGAAYGKNTSKSRANLRAGMQEGGKAKPAGKSGAKTVALTEAQKLRDQFERRFPEMFSQMSQGDVVEFRTMRTADLYRLLEDTGYVVGQNKDIDGDGKRATWKDVKTYRERGREFGQTLERRKWDGE